MTHLQLDRFVAVVLRRRWLVAALALLFTLAMAGGVRFITITSDYRIMFNEDNPQLAALNTLESTYSASNSALIAIAPQRG